MSLRITTDEHLYLTLPAEEIVEALFSTVHFNYSNVEHRSRLLDIPEAWTLSNVYLEPDGGVTLVFYLSESEVLRP